MEAPAGRRSASVRLPSDATSVRRAREHVAAFCDGHAVGAEVRDVVRLLVSELATNAITHAEGEVTVTVRIEADLLTVEVADASTRQPRPQDDAPTDPADWASLDEHGRGLQLVQALADTWGVETDRAGKRVHFSVHPSLAGHDPVHDEHLRSPA